MELRQIWKTFEITSLMTKRANIVVLFYVHLLYLVSSQAESLAMWYDWKELNDKKDPKRKGEQALLPPSKILTLCSPSSEDLQGAKDASYIISCFLKLLDSAKLLQILLSESLYSFNCVYGHLSTIISLSCSDSCGMSFPRSFLFPCFIICFEKFQLILRNLIIIQFI
jgi:hypothetical protein